MNGRSEQQNGRRIDHLVVLRDHVEAEIRELERAELVERLGSTERPAAEQLLEALGVSAREVKEWAVEAGLIAAVVRGRVSVLLVRAYAEAHR